MQKGLGIAALILAILSIFIPFIGTWMTILVAILAIFATGAGFGMGIAAIIINFVHIFFLSPLLWFTKLATDQNAANGINIESSGGVLPWILIGIQVAALVALIVLNKKSASTSPVSS